MDWEPLFLTFRLSAIATLILLIISIPLGYWLAYSKSKLKPILETLITMPLVLPPTVLGFYLLVVLSPSNAIGNWIEHRLGLSLIFSFQGLLVASIIYSLPFMVHPLQSGFANLPASLKEASYMLGKSELETLQKVLLPNIKSSILTGAILTFAHTIGEFGVVLMIGGNIPGETRVASIAIYDEVEALNYSTAHLYSLVLFLISFTTLFTVYLTNGGYLKRFWQ